MPLSPLYEVVDPLNPDPPRYGFLAAARAVENPGDRWYAGVAWRSAWCVPGGALGLDCDGSADNMVLPDRPGQVEAVPFGIWAADACSTMGNLAPDWEARARTALAARESALIAAEVWDGAQTTSEGGAHLADDTAVEVTAAPAAPVVALACVEAATLAASGGARSMVHMTPQVLTHLVAAGAVVREGSLWVTPMGSIVVADAGYSGNGPAAVADETSQWIYGTAMMRYRLSPVFTVPDAGDLPSARFDISVNNVAVYALRAAMVEWDTCAHAAAEVNVGLCASGA